MCVCVCKKNSAILKFLLYILMYATFLSSFLGVFMSTKPITLKMSSFENRSFWNLHYVNYLQFLLCFQSIQQLLTFSLRPGIFKNIGVKIKGDEEIDSTLLMYSVYCCAPDLVHPIHLHLNFCCLFFFQRKLYPNQNNPSEGQGSKEFVIISN